jgi:FkbM family methyltransferase
VILESGALDGVMYSVSRFFVFARGWRAVHVEGSPTSYARLAANRPESLNLHTALCNVSRTLHYAVNPAVPATSGFWEFIPAWIRTGFYANGNVDVAAMPLVPCRPLGPLLELHGVRHVNLWILDVEGAEEEVLTSVDFSRLTVDVVVAELDGGNAEKDARCHALLVAAGFDFHKAIVRNKWYVRRGFVPSAAGQSTFVREVG